MENLKSKIAATSTEGANSLRQFVFGDAHSHHFEELALERAPKEIACAFAASFLVSPMVSIIDKCIVKDISSTDKFMNAMKVATKELISQPKVFFSGLSFRLTVIVYFGTYAVANLSEMFLDMKKVEDYEERKGYKVAASAVANIGLLAWRDSVFAREFGGGKPKAGTPLRTIGLFAARDASTMYSTFYVAPKASDYLIAEYGMEKYSTEFGCALAIPVFTQIVTAPLHIHAMDYYNNPGTSTAARFSAIRQEFSTVAFARGFRILPAFGIGSFSNNRFREYFIRHDYDPEPNPNRLARRVTKALGLEDELPSVVQRKLTT
jgi:hypothetical protein